MIKKSGKEAREERERLLVLQHKYDNRITITKIGKNAFDRGDYATALQKFTEYMDIISSFKGAKDLYDLKPSHFKPDREVTEMLMVSHIFFELARIYDAIPKYSEESKKCLKQFVNFSANQPYQVVNSELIRKHLRKSVFKNPLAFRESYEQIYVQSKKCYIVTFCYGDQHPQTQLYRQLKEILLSSSAGQELVRIYYKMSSDTVARWEKSTVMKMVGRYLFRPILFLFSKTLLPLILKRCK